VTAAGIYVSGATTSLTRRTTLRKAFLGPWHPLVNQIILYSLADAQRHTGVAVHHVAVMPTHTHTEVTPSRANLPDFTRRHHRDVSCGLHDLLCQEKYDAPRELWDDRQTHRMRLLDGAAQASQMVYGRLNGVAAGLVDDPDEMPLVNTTFGMWKTRYLIVERPPVYFEDTRPERLRLELTPPPLLYLDFGGDLDRLIYHLDRLTDDGARKILAARTRPAMGADAMRRLHPWSEPRTMRESGGRRIVPTFRIGARGFFERERDKEAKKEVTAFRQAHHDSVLARRGGDFDHRFPFGTFAARVYHGAPVEPRPPAGALLTMPGPLLADLDVVLADRSIDRDEQHLATHAIVDEVRDALGAEASVLVEESDVDFPIPGRRRPSESTPTISPAPNDPPSVDDHPPDEPRDDDDTERPEPEVRHRFDRRRQSRSLDRAPRRLIIHRDRRPRDRKPPPPSGKHGSDPPVE
jgi:hypothetical protein